MAQKWANNATTTLATDLAPGALSMSVLPGAGVKFPTLAAGDFVQITLIKANGSLEIVRATAKTNDTFTIARAQEMPRVLLASVPYALKASDADTLGGLPASSYVTTSQLAAHATTPVFTGGGSTIIAIFRANSTSSCRSR